MRLTVQYFLGNPTMCRIPELDIRAMPISEGGGWWMPKEMAEFLVACVNGYADTTIDEASPLPSWAELAVYWKERAERAERYAAVTSKSSKVSSRLTKPMSGASEAPDL